MKYLFFLSLLLLAGCQSSPSVSVTDVAEDAINVVMHSTETLANVSGCPRDEGCRVVFVREGDWEKIWMDRQDFLQKRNRE